MTKQERCGRRLAIVGLLIAATAAGTITYLHGQDPPPKLVCRLIGEEPC